MCQSIITALRTHGNMHIVVLRCLLTKKGVAYNQIGQECHVGTHSGVKNLKAQKKKYPTPLLLKKTYPTPLKGIPLAQVDANWPPLHSYELPHRQSNRITNANIPRAHTKIAANVATILNTSTALRFIIISAMLMATLCLSRHFH